LIARWISNPPQKRVKLAEPGQSPNAWWLGRQTDPDPEMDAYDAICLLATKYLKGEGDQVTDLNGEILGILSKTSV
jgi:hypothetical protein